MFDPRLAVNPIQVNLRQLRNQAKDLHHSTRTQPIAADVLDRIRQQHPRFAEATPERLVAAFSLQEAQHVIAREQAFDSWPKLVAAVEDSQHAPRGARFVIDELRGLEILHETLAEALQARFRQAGQADAEVRVQFTDQVTWAELCDSRPIGWSYSYEADVLAGAALLDLPLLTAQAHDPVFAETLAEIAARRRNYESLPPGRHVKFAGPLFEDVEAAWTPVALLDMRDIEFEPDLEHPKRHVAEPSDIVACVQLSTADGDVAMRLCYPYKALLPLLQPLAQQGIRE
jgi:hypothetical protein